MRILHTESSNGWGGQEIRILKEAEGMRERGHEIFFAVAKNGKLIPRARDKGFKVFEINFKKYAWIASLPRLLWIIFSLKIDLVNTHSSGDSWLGGIAARLSRCKILRTRHLSTTIRKGINSLLLYRGLADFVVTTSKGIIPMICEQAKISTSRCKSIPTGVEPFSVSEEEAKAFRLKYEIEPWEILVGTACFVRSWKGINDFLEAARLLPHLKWMVIGGGYFKDYQAKAEAMGLKNVIFTGHLECPFPGIAALDIFLLLSTAHEGVSQASLQAAHLKKPLITTPIGGLPEVCLAGKTGLIVPPFSPEKVAEAVLMLSKEEDLRKKFGTAACELIAEKFTFRHTLDHMEEVYRNV